MEGVPWLIWRGVGDLRRRNRGCRWEECGRDPILGDVIRDLSLSVGEFLPNSPPTRPGDIVPQKRDRVSSILGHFYVRDQRQSLAGLQRPIARKTGWWTCRKREKPVLILKYYHTVKFFITGNYFQINFIGSILMENLLWQGLLILS